MRLFGILIGCGMAASAAYGQTIFIHNADVYPVAGAEMKGVSVLIQDGKIADIGAKLVAPKGVKTIEAKGLRVYPGIMDSGTELGLSEVSAVRESVDTGELGEFMPQLRALVAVNPESEHFGAVRVNGITGLALGKLDILTGLSEVKVAVAYRVGGKELREIPASIRMLERCEPIYKTFRGWDESLMAARSLEDLPHAARDYVRWLEDALEVPVDLLGVGPDRDATIERTNPFDRPVRR